MPRCAIHETQILPSNRHIVNAAYYADTAHAALSGASAPARYAAAMLRADVMLTLRYGEAAADCDEPLTPLLP